MINKISLMVAGILVSGAVLADPKPPEKEIDATLSSDEPTVEISSTSNSVEPEVALSSTSNSDEPEVAFSSTPNNDEPEVALSSTRSSDEPEVVLSSTPNSDEPEVALSSTPNNDEPEVALNSTPSNDEPEVAVSSIASSDEAEVEISSIVSSTVPVVEISASWDSDEPAEKAPAGQRSKWSAVFSASYLSINAEAAESQGLGNSGFSVEIAASRRIKTNFIASLGVGILRLQDEDTFSQRVVNSFGSEEDATSTAGAIPVFGEIAYRRMLSRTSSMHYQLGTGYTAVMAADRGIANCLNCNSEEFSINGGMYLSASTGRNLSGGSSFGITARQYLTGDLENGLMLWWKSK